MVHRYARHRARERSFASYISDRPLSFVGHSKNWKEEGCMVGGAAVLLELPGMKIKPK